MLLIIETYSSDTPLPRDDNMTYNRAKHAQLRCYTYQSAVATTRGGRGFKKSQFTCHCKNTTVFCVCVCVCVTSRFSNLIVGCGAIVSPTKKGHLFNLLESGLSAMKHLFLLPTLWQDVYSLNQWWLKALLPPFLRKKAHETLISVSIILIFWQRRAAMLHRIAQGHFITCQHMPGTQ